MCDKLKYLWFVFIILIVHASVISQSMVITTGLRNKLSISSDTSMHRVIVVFKERKLFNDEEKLLIKSMPEIDRKSYYLQEIHNFVKNKSENVRKVLTNFEFSGKVKILHDLWSANCVSILATKEVIEFLSALPEVENISAVSSVHVENIINNETKHNLNSGTSSITD